MCAAHAKNALTVVTRVTTHDTATAVQWLTGCTGGHFLPLEEGRCGIERCGIAIHLGCMHGGMIDPKWNKSGDLASQQCALRPPTCTLPFGPCVPACSCPAARESGTRWCLSGSSHMQPILGWPASPVALGCRGRTTAIGTELLLSRQLHDADGAGRRCDRLVASGMCDLPCPACSVHGSARVRSSALTAARSGWRGLLL